MFEYAEAAVQGAPDAGATYADACVVLRRSQRLSCLNAEIEGFARTRTAASACAR